MERIGPNEALECCYLPYAFPALTKSSTAVGCNGWPCFYLSIPFNAGKLKLYQVRIDLKKIEKSASAYRWKASFKGFSENTGFQGV